MEHSLSVSSAARQIAWESDEFWRQITDRLDRRLVRRRFKGRVRLAADCALVDGQVELTDEARPASDPTLVLRIGALAGRRDRYQLWENFRS